MPVDLKLLVGKLNQASREALESAVGVAVARGHESVGIHHFLRKLLLQTNSDIAHVCRDFDISPERGSRLLMIEMDKFKTGNRQAPKLEPELFNLLTQAWLVASLDYAAAAIRTGHILLAFQDLAADLPPVFRHLDWNRLRDRFDAITEHSSEAALVAPEPIEPSETGETTNFLHPKVFLSYRRVDSALFVDALFNRLLVVGCHVFRDVHTLRPGVLFRDAIGDTIPACDVVIAVIGSRWNDVSVVNGARRLDNAADFVRLELETAIAASVKVIPCVIGKAQMPDVATLPDSLKSLVERNAVMLSARRFQQDSEALVAEVQRSVVR